MSMSVGNQPGGPWDELDISTEGIQVVSVQVTVVAKLYILDLEGWSGCPIHLLFSLVACGSL